MRRSIASISVALAFAACGPGPDTDPVQGKTQDPERIDTQNDPSRFRLEMERRFQDLPRDGESTRKPFPSNWWPMRQGGAARRWLGSALSPAEKYDQLTAPGRVRDVQLTLAKKNWKDEPVNENAQPENFHIGPAAEWEHKNHGRYGRVDPDSWWGHCNGWSSYVLNEDEPKRPVSVKLVDGRAVECAAGEQGCVRFELGDINALGAELYWSDAARMLGRRCEQESSKFEFDEAGRIDAVECRDGNAGSFHLVLANMLGILQRPFIVDLTADFQVWNYPVYRFQVLRADPIAVDAALREIEAPAGTTSWIYNTSAVGLVRVSARAWIVEDAIPPTTEPVGDLIERYTTLEDYEYILELDANGDIVGGEWVGDNKTRHPDFLWYSYRNSSYTSDDDQSDGDNPYIRYSVFKQILTLAQTEPQPPPPPPGGEPIRLSAEPRRAIPDNDPVGIQSELRVDRSGRATSVEITVDLTHTYRGDLVVQLVHGGRTLTLHNQTGGSADNLRATFRPQELVGSDIGGTWTLVVQDHAAEDTGRFERWSLTIVPESGGGGGGGGGGGTTVTREYRMDQAVRIPDADRNGIRSVITVGDSLRVEDLTVEIDITHSYVGDLKVTLSNGTATQVLHDHAGGSARNLQRTFKTNAFRNSMAQGMWTLSVIDDAREDVGTLQSWRMTVVGTPL